MQFAFTEMISIVDQDPIHVDFIDAKKQKMSYPNPIFANIFVIQILLDWFSFEEIFETIQTN